MIKRILIVLLIFTTITSIVATANNDYNLININIMVDESKVSDYSFEYSTKKDSEITYITYMLDSLIIRPNRDKLTVKDSPIVNIDAIKADGTIDNYNFPYGRYIHKEIEQDFFGYGRVVDFISALKDKRLILPDYINFETSEWAQEEVNKSIELFLTPVWNRINYTGDITRYESCQLIYELMNKLDVYMYGGYNSMSFVDMSDDAIGILYSFGIINGKSETEFCPYDYITREEFAKILSRTYHELVPAGNVEKIEIQYNDISDISSWAVGDVADMTSLGLFQGDEFSNFNPQGNITKEEVIVTILRLFECL